MRLPALAVRAAASLPEGWRPDTWPATVPCVRQLLDEGLELGPLTILVGENGSGKSTLVEGIAQAYGLSPEGGSTGARHSTRPTESPLWRAIRIQRGIGAARWGFFLRAETMHGFYTYLEANPSGPQHADGMRGRDPLHDMSHGESFSNSWAAASTIPACTCSTNRSRRCRSAAAWPWWGCCIAWPRTAGARRSWPLTPR